MDAEILGRGILMSEHISYSLQRRSRISEVRHDIRRMEVDLDSSIEQTQLIREAIDEKQHQLDRLQRRRTTRVSEDDHDEN